MSRPGRSLLTLSVVALAAVPLGVAIPPPTTADARVPVHRCGRMTFSGEKAPVYSVGKRALGCRTTRSNLRTFIRKDVTTARVRGWRCVANSVQGPGYPPDIAFCQRGGREIKVVTSNYGE